MNSRFLVKSTTAMALAAAIIVSGCSSPQERAQKYYANGKAYLDKGEFALASVEFRNALKIRSDFADAWFGMAQIEEHDQNWPLVLGDLQKVVELDPNHYQAYEALAKIFLAAGELPNALKNANLANDKKPNDPDILALKAAVLYKLQDIKGARDIDEQVLKLDPEHLDGQALQATMQLDAGDYTAALETADKALSKKPKALPLYLLKLRIFEKQQDLANQELIIREIVGQFPDQPEYNNLLISFLIKHGKSDEAEHQLRTNQVSNPKNKDAGLQLAAFLAETKGADAAKAELQKLAAEPDAPIEYRLQIADIDYDAGRRADAVTTLRAMAEQLPIGDDGMKVLTSLSAKLLDDGQLPEAEKWITKILKNDALNAKGLKLKGGLELAKGNFDAAVETLRLAQTNAAQDPDNHLLLASAYERKGSFDLATTEFGEAMRVSNDAPRVAISFANYLLRRGNMDRADDVLTEAASQSPQDRDLISMLADLKLKKQDWKGAEDLANMLKATGSDQGLSDQIMGNALLGQRRFDDAISLFQASMKDAPNNLQPQFALVKSYIGAGKIGDAQAFVQSLITANPKNVSAKVLMGNVMLAAGKPDDAKKSFEDAIAADGTSEAGYLALAEFSFSQKDLNGAIAALSRGVAAVKDNFDLRMALGAAYELTQDFDKATEQYEQAVAQDPGSLAAINNYASLVGDHVTDPEKLKQVAALAKPLQNSPVPQFRETFGWISVVGGDPRAGVQVLEQTISKLDTFGLAHYHLGVAYAKTGEKDLAEKQLNRALDVEKSDAVRGRITQALQQLKSGTL